MVGNLAGWQDMGCNLKAAREQAQGRSDGQSVDLLSEISFGIACNVNLDALFRTCKCRNLGLIDR